MKPWWICWYWHIFVVDFVFALLFIAVWAFFKKKQNELQCFAMVLKLLYYLIKTARWKNGFINWRINIIVNHFVSVYLLVNLSSTQQHILRKSLTRKINWVTMSYFLFSSITFFWNQTLLLVFEYLELWIELLSSQEYKELLLILSMISLLSHQNSIRFG